MAGPDRLNWNLAKFWGGGREAAVLTDWVVVMVESSSSPIGLSGWRNPTGRTAELLNCQPELAKTWEGERFDCRDRLAGGSGKVGQAGWRMGITKVKKQVITNNTTCFLNR